jgi:predicted ATP-grasp superfamily ATP-dependent carboligase
MSPEIAPGKVVSSQWPIPAVVIGGELNGLGVCRSLARGGVPVCVVDCKRWSPALWSRYAYPILTKTLHGPDLVRFLRDLGSRLEQRPFLIVTDELALLTISEHRAELEGLYRFRLPAHDTVLMLHDKARFHESARAHGWLVPNGVVVRKRSDLAKIASLRLPMILKPADKRHVHDGRAPRLIVAENHPDALSAAERLLAQAGKVLVQETIEGPDDNIYFCLFYRGRDGETLGMFTARKLASSPPGIGSIAFCTPGAEEDLERTTKDLLDRVDYFGFGRVEYKRDARNGRFLIIEPTVGRTDWQVEAATLAGVNIPLIAYRHEIGLPTLHAGPVDHRVVWQGSWIERIRHGAESIPPRSVVVDGFFRRNDPLPALVHYPRNVAGIAARHIPRWLAGLLPELGRTDRPKLASSKAKV